MSKADKRIESNEKGKFYFEKVKIKFQMKLKKLFMDKKIPKSIAGIKIQ